MAHFVALDSNAMTRLIDAMQPGYGPSKDLQHLAADRVSMIRIFLYGGILLHLTPTASAEYDRIPDATKRNVHERIGSLLLSQGPWELDQGMVKARAAVLHQHYPHLADCTILAEAETLHITHLLTCEPKFISRLAPETHVSIQRPLDYWESLAIAPGSQPAISPHPTNPLAAAIWWRV